MIESWYSHGGKRSPYCNRDCTIGNADITYIGGVRDISDEHGLFCSTTTVIVCPNPKCRKYTISLDIDKERRTNSGTGYETLAKLHHWDLVPESRAKPFPDYIPNAILDDYREACLIKDKSPKASATLSRRCLQGMIRDFWGISKNNLADEIKELKTQVDSTTWEAIDSVRSIGNIGAHMEKDVNFIVDIEPEEAEILIHLIETLLEEWYIQRHERAQRMGHVKNIADQKKQLKTAQNTNQP